MSTKGHPPVSEYMKRRYPIRLDYSEEDECWFASHPDLAECLADGSTQAEALTNLDEAREVWFRAAIAAKKAIPRPSLPVDDEEYSGNFMVRGPRMLHRQLAIAADRQKTSMNKLVISLLSAAAAVSEFPRVVEATLGAFKITGPTLPPGPSGGGFYSRRSHSEEVWSPFLMQSKERDELSQRGSLGS